MRAKGVIAALLIAVMSYIVLACPARAHATLVSSDPADGAVVPAAPSHLILTFNEPVSPLVLRLIAPDNTSGTLQATVERESSLAIALPSGLPEGTHVVSWRVVSLDGHPVGGSVVFSIGAPSADQGFATQTGTNPLVVAALWTAKVLFYIGLFFGIGGSFFLAWLAPHSTGGGRTTIAIALTAGLVATPMLVGLQGTDALELPLAGLASTTSWRTGFGTSFGSTAVVAALALVAGFLALAKRASKSSRGLALIGLVSAGLALTLSGHASSAAPQWLTRLAVLVHTISLVFWIGALVPLGAILPREPAPEASLGRFSRAIPWAIAVLVASGAVLAVIQVGDPRALFTTAYGLTLCAKLCLVALVLACAAWNRFTLTQAVLGGYTEPRRKLVRFIALEAAIVIVILGLVATWRFTPPPRALAIASARPALAHIHTSTAMADVTMEPGRAGIVQVSIVIMTGDFRGLDAREVRLTLENKSAGIEAISRQATKDNDAIWRIRQFPVPSGGRWKVTVDILVNDFEKITLEEKIDIENR